MSNVNLFIKGILELLTLMSIIINICIFVSLSNNKMDPVIKVTGYLLIIIQILVYWNIIEYEFRADANDAEIKISIGFILVDVIIFILTIISMHKSMHWKKTHISTESIKQGMDNLPLGICFFEMNGRPILVNHKMNRICKALTGSKFSDGNEFWEKIKSLNISEDTRYYMLEMPNGEVYSFRYKIDNNIMEITAQDVTDSYELNREIKKKNELLKNYNRRLKEYGRNIENVTRKKEILGTKIKIHDDIGMLLLIAKRTLLRPEDKELKKENLNLWRTNLKLLDTKEEEETNLYEDISKIASTIGVTIEYSGEITQNIKNLSGVFITAIHECLTNTVSHAHGDILYVDFFEEKDYIILKCRNNGDKPEKEITEGGGLTGLRRKVEESGGVMEIQSLPEFLLEIRMQKEEICPENTK